MSFSVQMASGAGVLARFGDSIVLTVADSPLLDKALALAKETPADALPRKMAGLIAMSDETPTLALVCARDDGLAVLLVGDVSVSLTDAGGSTQLSGRDATTWVDRIVRSPWTELELRLTGAGAVDQRSDLQGGVVTAAGARLLPAGASNVATPAPPELSVPEPAPSTPLPAAPAPFESFSLAEPVVAEPLPVADAAEPLPVAGAEAPDGAVMVRGIECSRQHFNDPTAIFCSVCGISMVHQTHNLVSGPRPPLGVIVLDDGAIFTVDRDYVLGREPDNAEEVLAGTARPLTLDDPDVTMSRVHAKLLLDGWEVRLVDAGSANGTFTAGQGESDWTRVPAGGTVVLKPGARISIGGRTLVFDSHHKL